jgi:hypothetical protein
VGAGSTTTLPHGEGGGARPELEEGRWCSRNKVGEGRRGKQAAAGRGWGESEKERELGLRGTNARLGYYRARYTVNSSVRLAD